MTDIISILIIDDNPEFRRLLQANIDNEPDMQVIGTAGDGKTAFRMIRELKPDMVLLDMIMPRLDGLGVLEKIIEESPPKKLLVIAFTAIGGDAVVRKALELGADYYIMKPFDTDVLLTRIRQLCNEKRSIDRRKGYACYCSQYSLIQPNKIQLDVNNIDQIIADLIKGIGVTPNLAGYKYLREAVRLGTEQPDKLRSVSRYIYTELAEKYDTNVRNIDRSIRCAILSVQKKTKNASNCSNETHLIFNCSKNPNSASVICFLVDRTI